MNGKPTDRLKAVRLDAAAFGAPSPEVEHERQVAIFDLLDENRFQPDDAPAGPYELDLGLEEGRLALDITGPGFERRHILSLTPLRSVIRDYAAICESYYEAVRNSTPTQMEAIDMGRRGLHNEGSQILQERLHGKIEVDHETARRLFTLICTLFRRS